MLHRLALAAFLAVSPTLAQEPELPVDDAYNVTLPGVPGVVHSAALTIPLHLLPADMPLDSFIKSTGNTVAPFDVYDQFGRKLGSLLAGSSSNAPFTFRPAM